jgi:hypothetical protein
MGPICSPLAIATKNRSGDISYRSRISLPEPNSLKRNELRRGRALARVLPLPVLLANLASLATVRKHFGLIISLP